MGNFPTSPVQGRTQPRPGTLARVRDRTIHHRGAGRRPSAWQPLNRAVPQANPSRIRIATVCTIPPDGRLIPGPLRPVPGPRSQLPADGGGLPRLELHHVIGQHIAQFGVARR